MDGNNGHIAKIKMNIFDFGPDCKIIIDGGNMIALSDYYKDGVCDNISVEYTFDNEETDSSVSTKDVKFEVYRMWKGVERLIFTRYIRLIDGENNLIVSFNGIRNSKSHSSFFKRAEQTSADSTHPTA